MKPNKDGSECPDCKQKTLTVNGCFFCDYERVNKDGSEHIDCDGTIGEIRYIHEVIHKEVVEQRDKALSALKDAYQELAVIASMSRDEAEYTAAANANDATAKLKADFPELFKDV